LWRQNDVARALDKKFDEQYTYDGLNRLTDAKTGLLNGSHIIPPGSDTIFQQQWSLDYVGNWSAFNQDDDGDGTFDLEQTRTASPVNEITNIAATTGPTWTTPQYDRAGNTTRFPKPATPTESFTAVYDAWNRMVRVIDSETDHVVQENVYDGRNFRIIKKSYEEGVLDETRHIYYTSSWQAIEERLGTDPDTADAAQQYVWGIRYIDDLVLRDRDTSEPPDGTLDERLYAISDHNWSIIATINISGLVQERYEYQAYGTSVVLDNNWNYVVSTGIAWTILLASYHCDLHSHIYSVRYRALHAALGRWTQRDPLGYADSFHVYSYVSGSPIDMIDPSGLQEEEKCCVEFGMRFKASGPSKSLIEMFVGILTIAGTPNAPTGLSFLNGIKDLSSGGTVSTDTIMTGAICCGNLLWITELITARLNAVQVDIGAAGVGLKGKAIAFGAVQLTLVWDHKVGWGQGPTESNGAIGYLIADPQIGNCTKQGIENGFGEFFKIIRGKEDFDPNISMSFKATRWNKKECPKPGDCDKAYPRPASFTPGDQRIFDLALYVQKPDSKEWEGFDVHIVSGGMLSQHGKGGGKHGSRPFPSR